MLRTKFIWELPRPSTDLVYGCKCIEAKEKNGFYLDFHFEVDDDSSHLRNIQLLFIDVKKRKRSRGEGALRRVAYDRLIEVHSPRFFNLYLYAIKPPDFLHYAIYIDDDDIGGFLYQFICKSYCVSDTLVPTQDASTKNRDEKGEEKPQQTEDPKRP